MNEQQHHVTWTTLHWPVFHILLLLLPIHAVCVVAVAGNVHCAMCVAAAAAAESCHVAAAAESCHVAAAESCHVAAAESCYVAAMWLLLRAAM